jgi:hypothetical protein
MGPMTPIRRIEKGEDDSSKKENRFLLEVVTVLLIAFFGTGPIWFLSGKTNSVLFLVGLYQFVYVLPFQAILALRHYSRDFRRGVWLGAGFLLMLSGGLIAIILLLPYSLEP